MHSSDIPMGYDSKSAPVSRVSSPPPSPAALSPHWLNYFRLATTDQRRALIHILAKCGQALSEDELKQRLLDEEQGHTSQATPQHTAFCSNPAPLHTSSGRRSSYPSWPASWQTDHSFKLTAASIFKDKAQTQELFRLLIESSEQRVIYDVNQCTYRYRFLRSQPLLSADELHQELEATRPFGIQYKELCQWYFGVEQHLDELKQQGRLIDSQADTGIHATKNDLIVYAFTPHKHDLPMSVLNQAHLTPLPTQEDYKQVWTAEELACVEAFNKRNVTGMQSLSTSTVTNDVASGQSSSLSSLIPPLPPQPGRSGRRRPTLTTNTHLADDPNYRNLLQNFNLTHVNRSRSKKTSKKRKTNELTD